MANLTPSNSQWTERDGAAVSLTPDDVTLYLIGGENRLKYSQTFQNAIWTNGGLGNWTIPTRTDNFATAPDGTTTACKVVHSGVNNCGFEQIFTPTAGTQYTVSIYVKARSGSTALNIYMLDNRTGYPAGGYTVGLQSVTLTGSWQRVSVTGIAGTGATQMTLTVLLDGLSTTQQIDVWGAQANAGSSALSYTATTSSANTDNIYGLETDGTDTIAFEDTGSSTYTINDAATTPVAIIFFDPNAILNP